MALQSFGCDGCGSANKYEDIVADPAMTYYPAQVEDDILASKMMASKASTAGSRSRSHSPVMHPRSPMVSSPGSPASPMNTAALSTVALSSACDDEFCDTDVQAGYDSPVRLRYVAQAGLAILSEKVRKHHEVTLEELEKLAAPDQLADSEQLVPVHLDPSWVGGVHAAVLQKGGPKEAVLSLVAARDRAEEERDGETLSAKEWRLLMRQADGVLKPYLVAFVTLTALGSGTLLTLVPDASRQFLLLLTVSHVALEMMLLTYLLFGAQPNAEDALWKPRILIRTIYLLGFMLVAFAPLRSDGLAGPVSVAAHVFMASLGDAVCLWFGLWLCMQRLDVASRRLGGGLLCHGLAAQLGAIEFLNPDLFCSGKDEVLKGWGWALMALGTGVSLCMLVPVFAARHLDMRTQHPTAKIAYVISGLAGLTVCIQPIVGGALPDLGKEPAFLPRGALLVTYKLLASIGGIALAVYAVTEFNIAKQRPLSPTLATFVGSEIWRSLQWID